MMRQILGLSLLILGVLSHGAQAWNVGIGIADCTGPAAEIGMVII